MSKILEILVDVLRGSTDPRYGGDEIKTLLINEENQKAVSQGSCAYRICRSLTEIEVGTGTWQDFLGHLRQAILFFNRNFVVSDAIFENIEDKCNKFGIFIDNSTNEVNAINNFPRWFNNTEYLKKVYALTHRRDTDPVLGDGILYQMSGYKNYSSAAQKTIIRASMKMPAGSTLLASLPTGGGKSLIAQLPSFYETQGGKFGGSIEGVGVTIVVVPTVALAIDQATSARKYFKTAVDESHLPWAYYGDMNDEDKKLVRDGLTNGTIPLLYTSPEAIINGAFSNIILDSARHGKISRMVIDEAHIVVDWGASFRTEFQLLAAFRRKILKEGRTKLKTILMSATLTNNTVDILRNLFSEGDNFIEVRSDSLRPEPMFWLFRNSTEEEREERILEILPLLPRPIILYVTYPKTAEKWEQRIRRKGFTSVTTFTGKTTGNGREDIIDRWNNDQIDIMVATSAFGMGVDKRDIRTIIHCCMPESLNRFYQEVGRGGRDGFPSISILSVVPTEDYDATFNLINKNILKAETYADRWESMLIKPQERISGDILWLNTDRRRTKLEDQTTGQLNADWNTATLLFLYRKGLIDILDVEYDIEERRHHILVKLKDIELLQSKDELRNRIKPLRDRDWNLVLNEYNDMKKLTNNFKDRCWAEFFTEVYTLTHEKCGGCPKCMRDESGFYNLEGDNWPLVEGYEVFETKKRGILGIIGQLMEYERELFLSYDNAIKNNVKFISIFNQLVDIGVNNIVIPEPNEQWDKIVREIPGSGCSAYSVFEVQEITKCYNNYFLYGVTAVFYPKDKLLSDKLYNWTRNYINKSDNNQVIHLAPDDLFIQSENAYLKNKIKPYYTAESMVRETSEQYEIDLF